jgi:hypothetical protein
LHLRRALVHALDDLPPYRLGALPLQPDVVHLRRKEEGYIFPILVISSPRCSTPSSRVRPGQDVSIATSSH